MKPQISVVVPSWNDADMLERCLAALAVQTREPDEVIVVDNGSTDATVAVAERFGARVVTELHRGIPQATSAGFDAAKGDLIGRLDADSVPPPDWVERVLEAFESDPGLDALSGPGIFYGGSALTRWVGEHLYVGAYTTLVTRLLGHDVLFGSNLALRASVWQRLADRTHRDVREVHDDLDLTINLEPGMGVRFDPTLTVGVSARPFDTARGLTQRVGMAFTTFWINHREHSLLRRRKAWRSSGRGPA